MIETDYDRIDVQALEGLSPAEGSPAAGGRGSGSVTTGVRWFVIPLSVIACVVQAVVTITASNVRGLLVTSTLIAVLAMVVLFAAVLLINPALRVLYLGRWLPRRAVAAAERLMGWAGRLTLASALAFPAVAGPRFMLWPFIAAAAVAVVVIIADVLAALLRGRRARMSGIGQAALRWLLALLGVFVVIYAAAVYGPAEVHVALPGGSRLALSPGLLPLLICAPAYLTLWIFFSRGLNRAELMTVAAALIVTSGISTGGLCEQLVPLIAAPYNSQWNTAQSGWSQQLLPNLKQQLYITDPAVIRTYREGLHKTLDGRNIPIPNQSKDGLGAWAGFYWTVAWNLPWGQWLGPLGYWMIFILGCYALFYCLTYVVLGHWSNREKIIFPLAKLPESLLPEDSDGRWLPAIFRSTGFWVGLLLVAMILSYNQAIQRNWLSGMGDFPLGMSRARFTSATEGTLFEGLGGGPYAMEFTVTFMAVGIAFLLPLEISFSIWFYYIVGRMVFLVLVWTGHGRDMRDFPVGDMWTQNPVSAQGGGAIIVFSVIMLYRTMKDTLHQVFSRTRSWSKRCLSLLPLIGLAASILLVSGWVWWNWSWNPASLIWALIFVLFVTLITLGLMRITAEGGVYWYKTDSGFFHFWRALGLGSALPGALMGPLLPIYSVLFLEVKAFMAPNLANAGKMRLDTPAAGRFKFHLNMVLAILVSVAVSLGYAIVTAYARGAQRMAQWFYSDGPRSSIDTAYQVATAAPKFDPVSTSWMSLGAVWVVVSVIARRTLFWFPHPIGYIMMINPLMDQLWFSFFVAWVCKKLVVQYGGKSSFDKLKGFFIGLIMGEILTFVAWMTVPLA